MTTHQPGIHAIFQTPSLSLAAALLLGATLLPTSAIAARNVSDNTTFHPCMALMQPTLRKEQKKAAQIRVKDLDARMLAFTNQLGRNPRMQATLECLMRQDD